jgi:4-hydroxy-3-polyprenylbenzoate decarboxylase
MLVPTSHRRTLTLALTGASGSVFAMEFLRLVATDERIEHVYLVASPGSLRVLAEEIGGGGRQQMLDHLRSLAPDKITLLEHEDIGAPIASGSFPVDAMVVLPCSMGTLGGIANGLASNLIERAADVCLKERRPLLLCVRETPFNLIHLRNMTSATEAGAVIFPCIPTLYNKPEDTTAMARAFAQRVLGHLGWPQPGAYVWQGRGAAPHASL